MAKPIISKFSVIDADQNNIVSYVCYDDTVDEVEYVIYDNASGNIIVDQTIQTSGSSSMRTLRFPLARFIIDFSPIILKSVYIIRTAKLANLVMPFFFIVIRDRA